jgi:preprotein translocase subunit SecE
MFKKVFNYISEVRQEMSKVSWPTRAELMESTTIVLILSAILAVFMFVVDQGLSQLVKLIM